MPEKRRRLSDKIIDAFNMACDKNDLEVAEGLYQIFETALTRYGGKNVDDRRQNVEFHPPRMRPPQRHARDRGRGLTPRRCAVAALSTAVETL